MNKNKKRVIVCVVGKEPEIREIEPGLEAMQEIVGGLIDRVSLDADVDAWVNDEGLLLKMPPNRILTDERGTRWPLFGNFFLIGLDRREGDSVSLTDEQIEKWLGRCRKAPRGYVPDICEDGIWTVGGGDQ